MLPLARDGVHIEVGRFDGERLLQLELVLGVVEDEVELLQGKGESNDGFLPRERTTLKDSQSSFL